MNLPGAVSGGPFDIVFLDPPYAKGLSGPILEMLLRTDAIAAGSIVCAETGARELLEAPTGLALVDDRTYGAARLHILRV